MLVSVPRKVRELIRDLLRAGFVDRGGKGSHRDFTHAAGWRVTISGNPGNDVKHYLERDVRRAVEKVRK